MSRAAYAELLRRPVAYHPVFRKVTGSTVAAVMVSQMYYWSSEGRISAERDGWFHKTISEWEAEIGLSRSEQERARRDLVKAGVLEEARKGSPARMWFRLRVEALLALVAQYAESCKLESTDEESAPEVDHSDEKNPKNYNKNNGLQNPANQFAETGELDCEIQQPSLQNPANSLTENTTEIIPEITAGDAGASSSTPVADHPPVDPDEQARLDSIFGHESSAPAVPATTPAVPNRASRDEFEMHHEWQPSELDVRRYMSRQVAMLGVERVQQELDLFRLHFDGAPARRQGQWVKAFVSWLNRVRPDDPHSGGSPTPPAGGGATPQQKRAAVSAAIMDINDTSWGD
ncbi:DnaT-like ssDNA-binding domain-containing protein [Marinobacterium stanieri]|uniref:DnaT-like ssDNA-binding domain-containing protein n=1 Tax=Marinobacterium stanieri TaxID=49186 RepID=UPI0002557828|nr:DnaT-like ssDNA-binding domain-containing protein [Marinobacterium stanieri]